MTIPIDKQIKKLDETRQHLIDAMASFFDAGTSFESSGLDVPDDFKDRFFSARTLIIAYLNLIEEKTRQIRVEGKNARN